VTSHKGFDSAVHNALQFIKHTAILLHNLLCASVASVAELARSKFIACKNIQQTKRNNKLVDLDALSNDMQREDDSLNVCLQDDMQRSHGVTAACTF
jgi:hypothetical protein